MSKDFSITNILMEEDRSQDQGVIKYTGNRSTLNQDAPFLSSNRPDQFNHNCTQWLPCKEMDGFRPAPCLESNTESQNCQVSHPSNDNEKVEIKSSVNIGGNRFQTKLSTKQLRELDTTFQEDPYPRGTTISTLSGSTGLSKKRIKVKQLFFIFHKPVADPDRVTRFLEPGQNF